MARRPLVPQNLMVGTGMPLRAQARVMRHPHHHFTVRSAPWNIQPVAIAPVIPGETLENARIQARVVTDPLASKLLGWWTEFHLFYVKHRDTSESAHLQNMVLNPFAATGVATVAGSAGPTYKVNGRPDYAQLCLNAVVDWYFRDQGEDHTTFVDTVSGLPLAKFGRSDWQNSRIKTSLLTTDDVSLTGLLDTASELEGALIQYEWLKQNNLTDMTYEDWLATYGVRTQRAEVLRPELLRSIREFSFPTNTVTQGTGAVTSAVVWSIAEKVEKKRFFNEPGWLFLVSVTKPKIYRRSQRGAVANIMDTAYTWLPAVLRDDPTTSLVACDSVTGPLSNDATIVPYTIDIRDLLLYGDQWQSIAPSVAGAGTVGAGAYWPAGIASPEYNKMGTVLDDLQSSGDRGDYPHANTRNACFAGTTHETRLVQIEGVISFDVASSVIDTSPGVPTRT